MKKTTSYLYILSLFFISCEEVVQIEVPSIAPKLIIDASFQVFFDETIITANTNVKLSKSANYFDNTIPSISNATVYITNTSNNVRIDYVDENSNGNFKPIINFIPEDNIKYQLTVIYENQTYIANATKIKTPTFISVVQGDKSLFSGKETEVIITFSDDETQENYYLFDFSNNIYNLLEDRFFNGTDYNFSTFYQEDKIELPADVVIKMAGISKEYYTYFRVLLNQSGQGGGGPFQTAPTALSGNIINNTKIENFPLGYFHISETDTFNISLVKKE